MAFIESRLLDRVAYGFTGGDTFLTTRVPLLSGHVARNAERILPLFRGSAPYESIEDADRAEVINVFNVCVPGPHSFRFKNWQNYQGTLEVIGTAVGGVDETMQLIKTYTLVGQSTIRNIVKPVTDTTTLFEDGVPLAFTIDTTTGIVTFTSTAGKVITATYEFDIPVMFDTDDLPFSIVNWAASSADIDLMEDLRA